MKPGTQNAESRTKKSGFRLVLSEFIVPISKLFLALCASVAGPAFAQSYELHVRWDYAPADLARVQAFRIYESADATFTTLTKIRDVKPASAMCRIEPDGSTLPGPQGQIMTTCRASVPCASGQKYLAVTAVLLDGTETAPATGGPFPARRLEKREAATPAARP